MSSNPKRARTVGTARHADFDVLIVGGGMVGASLACALAGHGLRIGIVEGADPEAVVQPSYDDRAIALAYGSRQIFSAIGVWPRLAAKASPIRRIHVSDRGHFGITRLDSQAEGVDALGYVVSAHALGESLATALEGRGELDWIRPARVIGVHPQKDVVEVWAQAGADKRRFTTRLLVASDGGDSVVRDQLRIPVMRWHYGQAAIIANVTPDLPHQQVAYERFTDSGPLAFLPLLEGRCSVVWTVREQHAEETLALSDHEFLQALQERFGMRLGQLKRVGRRQSYPLSLVRARNTVVPRVALVGNAAHALHPVAGQGFNLGLRDVAVLAEVLVEAGRSAQDPGDPRVLQRYAAQRRRDHRTVAVFTDVLARLFSNPLLSITVGRNIGLLAVDLLPGLKHRLARHTMGLAGHLPRLARGLSL